MQLTLHHTIAETSDIITYAFESDEPIQYQAGQYLTYTLPHEPVDDRGIKRWFTNSAAPHERFIHITTRHSTPSSSFKQALHNLKSGESIEAESPEGDFVVQDPSRQFVFIAGGIGITPFRSILTDLHYRGEPLNVTLIYANKDKAEIPFKAELNALNGEHPEMDIHYVTGKNAITESFIRDVVPVLEEPIFYVSGPEPMVEALGELLFGIGIKKSNLKQDLFPNYPS